MSASVYRGVASGIRNYRTLLYRREAEQIKDALRKTCVSSPSPKDSIAKTEQDQLSQKLHHPQHYDLNVANSVTVSPLQKKILVHFKYFKDVESTPDRVPFAVINKATAKARVKVGVLMVVISLIICFFTAWWAKSHRFDNSLVDVNLKRHEAYKKGQDFFGRRLAVVTEKKGDPTPSTSGDPTPSTSE